MTTTTNQEIKFTWYPYADNVPDWAKNMNQYSVRISRGDVSQDFDYFKGVGIVDDNGQAVPPSKWEVLETLISDWLTLEETNGFENWASSFGYDSDSIKALNTYKDVVKNSAKLLTLLPEDEARELYNVMLDGGLD